ncbi:uncharacterized protein LOC125040863 [Penaeus chinensis]|uniref:uncharacterized protein LOC125040863 n=1 Tax=Penaeus chinensis TaxID=139456 RepID=UPI001FB7BB58|nr:uncharacterized protein LOC125040863 [Penaeus chinensis]
MNFLKNRTYQIVIGNKKSIEENIVRGLPQGSPLSPLLFNIMTTDLNLTDELKKVTYADDITIIAINNNLAEAKNKLELGLKQIIEWANKWELTINLTKSKLMCFTKNRIREIPMIQIDNKALNFTTNHTILGLEFDAPKLTWKKHMNNLKINCSNRTNLMKKISSTTWGSNRENMIKFYDIYIKPKIEYGISIIGTANNTEMKKLEIIQNNALRIATGCLKTTPILALFTLTNKMPFKYKQKEMECMQVIKILEKQENNQMKRIVTANIEKYNPEKDKRGLVHRVIETCKELQITIKAKTIPNITPIPPWFDITNNIETNFLEDLAKNVPEQIIKSQFFKLENTRYLNNKKIFTDGSKLSTNSTSAAIYIQDKNITTIWKLPDETEIIEAELFAIKQGITYIQNNRLVTSVIFSDSKSALQLISNLKPKNYKHIIFEIQAMIYSLTNQKQTITIQWIPSHKNIRGNEIADQAAKKAHTITNPITIYEDKRKKIKQIRIKYLKKWETQLNSILNTKNYLLKNTEPQPWTRSKNRKLDVCITRLKTTHTRLNQHLHKVKIVNDPTCRWCHHQEENIEHIMLQCPRFHSYRTELMEALKRIKINNPNIDLLLTGADFSPIKKCYILRHTKIFLKKTRLIEII